MIRSGDTVSGVLTSSVAPGRAIDDIIADAGPGPTRAEAMAELQAAIGDTAAALAELHTKPRGSGGPVAAEYLDFHIGLARRLGDQVLAAPAAFEESGLSVVHFSRELDAAITAAGRAPAARR